MRKLTGEFNAERRQYFGKLSLGLLLCVCAILGSSLYTLFVNASPLPQTPTPTLRMEPITSVVGGGDTIVVHVMIDDVSDLGGYEFDMSFDASVANVNTVTDGGFLGSAGRTANTLGPNIDNTAGTLSFGAWTYGSDPGPIGTSVLATITLEAKGLGDTTLDLQNVQVTDTAGNLESISVVDGMVTVTFSDVIDHWAYDYIQAFARAGITGGCSADPPGYCPDDPMTRAQMAVFIVKALGEEPVADPTGIFNDVPPSHWAAGYIERFSQLGITAGCEEGRFCPEGNVSRAEMAVFLDKALGLEPYNNPTPTFVDVPPDHWAYGYIERFYQQGITAGCGEGNYCPDDFVTRAQMAVFIVKAFNIPL